MDIIKATISYILLALTLLVTYSIALVCGVFLAIGGAINYPLLYVLGILNGRQRIQRKTQ